MGNGMSASGKARNGGTKTNAQMERELQKHFANIHEVFEKFEKAKPGTDLEDIPGYDKAFDDWDVPIEKHTVKDIVTDYIKEYNADIKNGYGYRDGDERITVLYKDGKIISRSVGDRDGDVPIPTSNIDSVIVDGGWGTAVAGKSIRLYNMREETGYGRYAYRDIKQRYLDSDDIRADFK